MNVRHPILFDEEFDEEVLYLARNEDSVIFEVVVELADEFHQQFDHIRTTHLLRDFGEGLEEAQLEINRVEDSVPIFQFITRGFNSLRLLLALISMGDEMMRYRSWIDLLKISKTCL